MEQIPAVILHRIFAVSTPFQTSSPTLFKTWRSALLTRLFCYPSPKRLSSSGPRFRKVFVVSLDSVLKVVFPVVLHRNVLFPYFVFVGDIGGMVGWNFYYTIRRQPEDQAEFKQINNRTPGACCQAAIAAMA